MIVGTFIFYLANPLILNSISMVSNTWFAEDELARATAISGIMAPLGALTGLALAGVIAAGVDVDDPVDCMERLEKMIWFQNTIYTIFCALVFIF